MDILSEAQESLDVQAHGAQADSTKKTMPIWSMTKASRATESKVFLGNKFKQDVLGKDSPGPVYEPKRQRELPKWGFGTAPARPPSKTNKYNEPYNDLVGNIPDSAPFKFASRSCTISSLPRNAMSNAPDLKGFPAGRISPGPQRYNLDKAPPCIRLGHAPGIDQIPPSWTMRSKTKLIEEVSQTGTKIGPGYYPTPEACAPQANSTKKTLPQWSCCKHDRFKDKLQHDQGRLWDGFKEQKEKNCRLYNSSPSFSFGTSTRDHVKRLARCTTKLDEGPKGDMGHFSTRAPSLPTRLEMMKYSDVPAA
eukprot:TRINITY_DN20070_c0_g1_i1.p1 TRINITY_DN20070_c0_g1~~TRINITY_DN20070_c0_g1_i1.p1  ORF type:complete len:307 (-),score=50.62 TRINITY_DN20070_c0_g1_i1:184-1104(-)